jgi:uncharacterized membrane protein HdeD (DUF308 family)
MSANKEINRAAGWSIVFSVLMMVAGILAIVVPPASGIAVTILLGWLLVFCGGVHLAYAWETRHSGGVRWGLLLSVIYIAAGVYISLHPMAGLESLTLVLAAYLLAESVLEFILAYQLRPLRGSGWLVLDGIVTLILAVMIGWTWPSSSLWVVGTLVGISMLFSGITRLMLSINARRVAHAFMDELHEPEHGSEGIVEIN